MSLAIVFRRLTRQPAYACPLLLGWFVALASVLLTLHLVIQQLAPLPYRDTSQLHLVQLQREGQIGLRLAVADWRDVQTEVAQVDDAAAFVERSFAVQIGSGLAEQSDGMAVSGNYFTLLGQSAAIANDSPGVVLSLPAALRWFGSVEGALDDGILRLDGVPHQVLAVLPIVHVDPLGRAQLYQIEPVWFSKDRRQDLDVHILVRSPASIEALDHGLGLLSSELGQRYPDAHGNARLRAVSVEHHMLGDTRQALLALACGALLLLLLVLTNGLALSQARNRRQQGSLAVRHAIGQTHRHRWLENLHESLLLLGSAALLAGTGVCLLLLAIAPILSSHLPRMVSPTLSPVTLAAFVTLTLLLGGLHALLNSWHAERLLRADRSHHGERMHGIDRAQGWLLAAQCALALFLVGIGSAVLQSALKLSQVDPGFNPAGAWQVRLMLHPDHLPDAPRQLEFAGRLLTAISSLPGVDSAAMANQLPLDGGSTGAFVGRADGPEPSAAIAPLAQVRAVSTDYHQALGLSISSGRSFTASDDASQPPVAIVDEGLARTLFGEHSALQRSIMFEGLARQIVGTVVAPRDQTLDQPGRATIYLPLAQDPAPWRRRSLTLLVRASASDSAMATTLSAALRPFAGEALIARPQQARTLIDQQLAAPGWQARSFGLLGGTGLLLAAFGVSSVGALLTSFRQREFAICRALGASSQSIAWRAATWLLRHLLVGSLIGLLAIVLLQPLLQLSLYQSAVLSWPTLTSAVVLIWLAGALALVAPLRTALRVQPSSALSSL